MCYKNPLITQYLDQIGDFVTSLPNPISWTLPWQTQYGVTSAEDLLWQRIMQFDMECLLPNEKQDTELMNFLCDEDRVVDFLATFWLKLVTR